MISYNVNTLISNHKGEHSNNKWQKLIKSSCGLLLKLPEPAHRVVWARRGSLLMNVIKSVINYLDKWAFCFLSINVPVFMR